MANLGDVPGALQSYGKAIALLEPVVAAGGATDAEQATLATAYLTGGGIRLVAGDAREAVAMAEKGLPLRKGLAARHPGDPAAADVIRSRTAAKVAAGELAPVTADLRLQHGDAITFGNEVIHVLGTPGHTPACLSFLWRDRVFTGDALLIRACGRSDLPDADAGALYDSLTQRLMVLPGETLVFPGHDSHGRTVSTIAEEREHNPCVAGRSRDEFITRRIAVTSQNGRVESRNLLALP